jgi:Rieske Fe-S protein
MNPRATNLRPVAPVADQAIDRRDWMRMTIGVIIAGITSVVGVVAGGAVLSPAFAARKESWIPAGRLPDLEEGVPTPVTVRVTRQDGYYQTVDQRVVYLVKETSGGVLALGSTCTHLGCQTSYDADAKLIKCPCHGGVYKPDGTVVAGPPPQPLPHLATRVDGARVLVQL